MLSSFRLSLSISASNIWMRLRNVSFTLLNLSSSSDEETGVSIYELQEILRVQVLFQLICVAQVLLRCYEHPHVMTASAVLHGLLFP